ncbi:2OG-Fe(II) oxygenase family protein [Novosphingopyxis iocasae]|uniref:2OG-Fe(II) oxygenase family protein n=1 Tax=Novosphingopyxis iocasae TaxID=2762729 RepID=UPI0016515840|nr:putative 2OG-Fe(II) oxygenase [Novosphingopyxis iocasae]
MPQLNALLQQADLLLRRGNAVGAEQVLMQLNSLAPRQPAVLTMLARTVKAKGDLPAARTFFEQAVSVAPGDAGLRAEWASLLDDLGQHRDALTAYDQALRIKPDLVDAAIDRAVLLYERLGELSGLEQLRAICRVHPTHLRAWRNLATIERKRWNAANAIEAASHVLAQSGSDQKSLYILALATLDAGEPAGERFEKARRADPSNPELIVKHAAALLAEGEPEQAEALLSNILDRNPHWIDGHEALAQIRWETASSTPPLASLEAAATRHSKLGLDFWKRYISLAAKMGDLIEAAPVLAAARREYGDANELALEEAKIAAESDRFAEFAQLMEKVDRFRSAQSDMVLCRWEARMHRFSALDKRAARLIEHGLGGHAWPYRGLAWRALSDPRWHWLERDGELVSEMDLTGISTDIPKIAEHLRAIHLAKREPMEQSLRGGTQTDGMLFARRAPEIRLIVDSLNDAVSDYLGSLPPVDREHPLLRFNRDSFRFSGAWSVRLTGKGFHVPHFHHEGHISSAFYLGLPDDVDGHSDAGTLVIGEPPPEFGLAWKPLRSIRPRPGQLALFPSYSWHGTRPFATGERLTVAFDVQLRS